MPPVLRIADHLTMPLAAATETLGIFGQKGSGKSSTSAVFVEQGVHAGGRFVIADPTGVWWGLMHAGIGPGLPGIVFGGEHADVPLERTAGHVVAEFVVQQDVYPVVVLDMKLMRKADRTHFMLDFLETLYHDNREALHVVLDESWQFAPTQAREGGETIRLLGAVEDVVALGRARGLGITMISQRFATLNANVREQIGTLVVHRLVGSLDRKALKGWIEAQADPAREKEVMEVMAKLKTAQALVWSPAFLDFFGVVNIHAPQTFDSRATPKVGQRVKKPGKRAAVDLDTLRARMAETIERAQENDPAALKAKVRELEAKLAKRPPVERVEVEVEVERRVEVSVFTPEDLRWLEHIAKALEGIPEQLLPIDLKLAELRDAAMRKVNATVPDRKVADRDRKPSPPPAPIRVPPPTDRTVDTDRSVLNGDLPRPQQSVLDALAWWETVGVKRPTLGQIGFVVGYHPRSKGFTNYLSAMSTAGLIERTPGAALLTEDGAAKATFPATTPTDEDLQQMIYEQIGTKRAEMLKYLIEHPGDVSMEQLGEAMGYHPRSKGFTNNVSRLSGLGLVERRPGTVRASDLCFTRGGSYA